MMASFAENYRRLAAAQKGHARGAPAYSVYVNRRMGRVLAAAGGRLGMTPNQATAISAVHTFGAMAMLAFAPATWWTGIIVAVLLAFGYSWDSADGQLARLSGGGTLAGEWLDHFVDAVKIASLHLIVAIALVLHTSYVGSPWLLVPLAYSVVAVVTFFGMLLNDLLKGKKGVVNSQERGGGTLLRSTILIPTDYGIICLLFLLWGVPQLFMIVYALLLVANAAFLVLAAVKWFREIKALERHTTLDSERS